ncbi:hypothetical protein AB205_0098210 [Aquarana catesbeiana]|uniref:Transmembrane channel-like protein n=1 Tax=Aquarana catesbeiana TaxID=8400 RepID=A0A2G9RFW0_AQUCT|nr:hypothetical protein AB205_0098210 [Aquarana catesbeiana]
MRVLADMPSRTIGRCKGTMLSEYYNRTVRRRQSKKRPSLYNMDRSARPSVRQRDEVLGGEEGLDSNGRKETKFQFILYLCCVLLYRTSKAAGAGAAEDIGNPENSPVEEFPIESSGEKGVETQSPTNVPVLESSSHQVLFYEVKALYLTLEPSSAWKGMNDNSCCSSITDSISMAMHGCWMPFLSMLCALRPWHVALKQIGGRFGSSVLSYFLFLKTLLGFNTFMSLLCLLFIVTPQAVHPHDSSNPRSFTSLELFTGAGYFSDTVMYYGYYSNFTLNEGCSTGYNASTCQSVKPAWLPYHMPLAFLFTIGLVFLSTCIILVYRMSCSFGESFRVGFFSGALALKVFGSWDFKVNRIRCVQRQKDTIHMQLKVRPNHHQQSVHYCS